MLLTFLLLKTGCRETPLLELRFCSCLLVSVLRIFLANERMRKHDHGKSVVAVVCCVTLYIVSYTIVYKLVNGGVNQLSRIMKV